MAHQNDHIDKATMKRFEALAMAIKSNDAILERHPDDVQALRLRAENEAAQERLSRSHRLANSLRASIAEGDDPATVKMGLYQTALGWAAERGAADKDEFARAIVREVWQMVEAN